MCAFAVCLSLFLGRRLRENVASAVAQMCASHVSIAAQLAPEFLKVGEIMRTTAVMMMIA